MPAHMPAGLAMPQAPPHRSRLERSIYTSYDSINLDRDRVMARRPDIAPQGFFTIADAARITGVDRGRVSYWCSPWGAGLVTPEVNPQIRGGTKLLSEHDLVKIAVIPKLLQAGLAQAHVASMFQKAEPAWWDLSKAQQANPQFLDWIVIIRDWQFRLEWRLLAGMYKDSQRLEVGRGVLMGLGGVLNQALRKHGRVRGFQIIELSSLKRELLERLQEVHRQTSGRGAAFAVEAVCFSGSTSRRCGAGRQASGCDTGREN